MWIEKNQKIYSTTFLNKCAIYLKLLFLVLFLYTALITAWIGDDAQITFRQIWNFINGDGITYNFDVKVQAFSHPLWFLVLSVASFVTRELFLTTTIISIILSLSAVYLVLFIEYTNNKYQQFIFSPIFFLIFSFSFIDFMTSGLENTLSYFLFSLLILIFTKLNWQNHLKLIYFLLALLILNRIDFVVLFGPIAVLMILYTKSIKNFLKTIIPSVLILIAWYAFSTLYFGSPLPNTYYAKLNAGYPIDELLNRGRTYFLALRLDIVTPILILLGIIFSILSLNRILIALVIGQLLYLIYIYSIGGDFMQGRFFSVLVFISVCQLSIALQQLKNLPFKYKNIFLLTLLILVIPIGFVRGFPILSTLEYTERSRVKEIIDERGHYYKYTGLFSSNRDSWPKIEKMPRNSPKKYKFACGYNGQLAIKDSSIHFIDLCALTDPFLSRIPAIQTENWRIGHHVRKIPNEYGEYVLGNIDKLPDETLHNLLKDTELASKGELFTIERFKAILRLNSNFYSKLDLSNYSSPDFQILPTSKTEKITIQDWDQDIDWNYWPYSDINKLVSFNANIVFNSMKPRHSNMIELGLDNEHSYEVYVNGKLQKIIDPCCKFPNSYERIKLDPPIFVESIEIREVYGYYQANWVINALIQLNVHKVPTW